MPYRAIVQTKTKQDEECNVVIYKDFTREEQAHTWLYKEVDKIKRASKLSINDAFVGNI